MITHELLIRDIDEIVDYLRETQGQEEVIILWHSFGTDIGIKYAQDHPDKVSHYVGVGQVVSTHETLEEQVREAAKAARASGNEAAASDLEARYEEVVQTLPALKQDAPADEISAAAQMAISLQSSTYQFLPSVGSTGGLIFSGAFSPRATWQDFRWYFFGGIVSDGFYRGVAPLYWEHCIVDCSLYDEPLSYEVPITFITGKYDWVTPYTLVEEYLTQMEAPSKEIVYVPNAGHATMFDNPDGFADALMVALAKG